MSSKQIVVVWPSGKVLCEGQSALDEAPAPREDHDGEPADPCDSCPPTKRSRELESGVFRRSERAA
jgi:hypothetical protein